MATTRSRKNLPVAPLEPVPPCAVSAEGVPLFGGYEGIVATTGLAGLSADFRLGGSDPLGMVQRRIRAKSWVYVVRRDAGGRRQAVLMVNGAIDRHGLPDGH